MERLNLYRELMSVPCAKEPPVKVIPSYDKTGQRRRLVLAGPVIKHSLEFSMCVFDYRTSTIAVCLDEGASFRIALDEVDHFELQSIKKIPQLT